MNYYTHFKGTITLKDNVTKEDEFNIVPMILNKSGCFSDVINIYEHIIEVYGDAINYFDSQFYDVYEKINPYVETANIEFAGEDNQIWKHVCKDGLWTEYEGEIIYKNPIHIAGNNIDKKEDEIDDIER